MQKIKKRCPACVTQHRSHFIYLLNGFDNGMCPICGISFEVVKQNDKTRHKSGIDLVLACVI